MFDFISHSPKLPSPYKMQCLIKWFAGPPPPTTTSTTTTTTVTTTTAATTVTTSGVYTRASGIHSYPTYSFSDLDHSNCATEQDIGYNGNDVNDGTTNIQPDVDSCRSSCHAIHAPYFSYHPKIDKRCWCKSTDAGRTTFAHAVAGDTACLASTP